MHAFNNCKPRTFVFQVAIIKKFLTPATLAATFITVLKACSPHNLIQFLPATFMTFRSAFYLVTALAIWTSCSGIRAVVDAPETEYVSLDTMFISAPRTSATVQEVNELPRYNPSATRYHNLHHTRLDVSFDWELRHVHGQATLYLSPYFYATDRLLLDAKGVVIHGLHKVAGDSLHGLPFQYDGMVLDIDLQHKYISTDTFVIQIDYTARPDELETGGSEAITSDKGLYFINPDGSEKGKPRQIWTQGQTESNSRWFPTIDKPNERSTQEMLITVDTSMVTLSNGLLIGQRVHDNGTRTDHYYMDLPHAPYLFMLAVGEFAVVREPWRDIVLEYFVEPDYKPYAKDIYSHTPEMLDFFSDLFGVDFPWSKYSQIVVRDYVAGAMENTTGVIFGEFVQKTGRELIDNHNERIVAHELVHHWFGNLVTCESWANLPMNESFANYGEYLWFEHFYGRDEADYHLMGELEGYLQQASHTIHPLIFFGYEDKEDTFDAHSYNKGGCILHALRHHIGDDAFFASLTRYLEQHSFHSVEAHDLRLAVEFVTGRDMNWFFNQWFFDQGHPELIISYEQEGGTVMVNIEQVQNPERMPAIFQLPLKIDVYTDEGVEQHEVFVNRREQLLTFNYSGILQNVNVDAQKTLVGEKADRKPVSWFVHQLEHAPLFLDRMEAVQRLGSLAPDHQHRAALVKGLHDAHWAIRGETMSMFTPDEAEKYRDLIADMARNDPRSNNRAEAISLLAGMPSGKEYYPLFVQQIESDSAYRVIGACMLAIYEQNPSQGLVLAHLYRNEPTYMLLGDIGTIYFEENDPAYIPFFRENLTRVQGYHSFDFYEMYLALLLQMEPNELMTALDQFFDIATNMGSSPFHRFAATRSIASIRNYFAWALQGDEDEDSEALAQLVADLSSMIEEIKARETSSQLLNFYQMF